MKIKQKIITKGNQKTDFEKEMEMEEINTRWMMIEIETFSKRQRVSERERKT
jgi:phosphopantetheine adenylyltransferase